MSETGSTPEKVPRGRLVAAYAVSLASGFLLAASVHLSEGWINRALFAGWLLGPLIAGAILHTTRLVPYLVVGVLWFGTIPLQSSIGLLSVGPVADPSGPKFVSMFTLFALPFTAPLVAALAFVAGLATAMILDRFSGHGVED